MALDAQHYQAAVAEQCRQSTGLNECLLGQAAIASKPCRYCGRTRHLAKHTTCESCGAPR